MNLSNSDAGTHEGTAELGNGATSRDLGVSLTIKRHVWLLVHEALTKVKKNKPFWVYRLLDLADWNRGVTSD